MRSNSHYWEGYWQGLPHRQSGRTVEVMAASDDIREFLTTRRAKLTPDQAGLPVFGAHRRVVGLRREEVALLAGISVEYYTRLERGNVGQVSDSVLDGLVHALQLDEAERDHLYRLVRTASTPRRTPRRTSGKQRVRPSLQRILDQMSMPAYLRNGRFDVLAANDLGRALYSPLYDQAAGHTPGQPPNSARFIFLDPGAGDFFLDYDKAAKDCVAFLRAEAGRALRQGPVRSHRGAVHPQRGLPPPMGRPRRPLPPHRPQAVPPPTRRRH
jgi:transcriptional regulator with XRE-family HTH domain